MGCLLAVGFFSIMNQNAAFVTRKINLAAVRIAQGMVNIEQLPGERQKLVLTFRYVNGWNWNEICRRLCYGKSQVFRLHREALAGIAHLMKVSS